MALFCTRGERSAMTLRRPPRRKRLGIHLTHVMAWSAAIVVLTSSAAAQQYQADKVDEQARRLSGFTATWLRDPARYAAEKDRLAEYFTKAYFPSMTQYGPKDLESLGKKRYDLFNDFLWKTSNSELQSHLTGLAFDAMRGIAFSRNRNYHPAVRYNAVLVLGMLDKVYGDDRANRKPQPLPEANQLLTQYVDYASNEENRAPASLVVGALVGLERHARFRESLDPQRPEAMTASIRKLLSNEPPLADVDRDVSEWIKLRGAAVLARLGSPGAGGEVHQTLLDLLAGQDGRKMTLDSRCQLVALLALLNYAGASVDAQATADQIIELAADVAQAEAKRAKEFEDVQIGGGFGGGYPGRGGGYSAFGGPLKYDRRLLLVRFGDVRSGLQAVKPVLPADKQAAADTILAALKMATDAAEDKNLIDLDVASKVRIAAREIEQAADPGAPPAVEDPPADKF